MRHPAIAFVLFAAACEVPDDATNIVEQDVDSNNGTSLNGTSLNGTSLNGTSLNGTSLNGTSINGTSLNGTSITANSTTAPPITGSGAVGSTWNGTTSTGATIKLRIDSALQGTGTNSDLWFYGVSYQTSTGWSPLCGVDGGGVPIKAVPVAGYWGATAGDTAHYASSTTQFSWGCRGKTVGKCVELGYKTYKGYTNQLITCVRALRADYCGTGKSYTVDGQLLNIYDKAGVQLDTEAWTPEAEWATAGALCINSSKAARYQTTAAVDTACVIKVSTSTTCGVGFTKPTALIIDELP
jgi:ADYC domain-containing protein/pentapeptide repeat protein